VSKIRLIVGAARNPAFLTSTCTVVGAPHRKWHHGQLWRPTSGIDWNPVTFA